MKVRSIMTHKVHVIEPDQPVIEAARMMSRLDVGVLPVCSNDKLVGMVTDRDIITRVVGENRDVRITRVAECMTSPVFCSFEDEDVGSLVNLMEEKQIRRVAVLSRENRLVGIVSLGDLATETHNHELSGETLERISEAA